MTSSQPRKQRKSRYQAPLHLRHKFLGALLSEDLKEKHKIKTIPVRMGDTVKLLRGDQRGTEVPRPVQPSNVMITKLEIKDKRRLGD
jgi:large subunit ribosomal protein L24